MQHPAEITGSAPSSSWSSKLECGNGGKKKLKRSIWTPGQQRKSASGNSVPEYMLPDNWKLLVVSYGGVDSGGGGRRAAGGGKLVGQLEAAESSGQFGRRLRGSRQRR